MRVQSIHVLVATLLATGCNPDDGASMEPDAAPSMLPGDASGLPDAEPEPPKPDAGPERPYGAFCLSNEDCKSQVCYLQACSEACDIEVANSCRAVDAFCVPSFTEQHVCFGSIQTGDDTEDDAILQVGETLTGLLSRSDDADIFHVTLPPGRFAVSAEPMGELDVRLEMYDRDTKNFANANDGGAGATEHAVITIAEGQAPSTYYVVVRNLGSAPSTFTITAIKK